MGAYLVHMASKHISIKEPVISLPKAEFLQLRRQAHAYRQLTAKMYELPLRDPVHRVVDDFRATEIYSEAFLEELSSGLKKSSYAKRYGV